MKVDSIDNDGRIHSQIWVKRLIAAGRFVVNMSINHKPVFNVGKIKVDKK